MLQLLLTQEAVLATLVSLFVLEVYLELRERRLLKIKRLADVQKEQKRALQQLERVRKSIAENRARVQKAQEAEKEAQTETTETTAAPAKKDDKDAADPYSEEEFAKSQLYKLDSQTFSLVSGTFDTALEVFLLVSGFFPFFWMLVGSTLTAHGFEATDFLQGYTFTMALSLIMELVNLPWKVYSQFVLEERHGFNKTTAATFIADMLKSFALSAVIMAIVLYVVLWLVNWGGEHFWIYVWVALSAFMLLLITISPVVILPLFFEFTPVKDQVLKAKVDALVAKHKFPGNELYVVDGSRRSSHSNAFFTGLLTKRICLFDTLIEQCTHEEILAILGHEIGHWKLGHTIRNMVTQLLLLGLFLFGLSKFIADPHLRESFGFDRNAGPFIGLFLFQQVWGPVNSITSFAMNAISRRFEFEADEFAAVADKEVHVLTQALLKIHVENKSPLWSDWMYSAYHRTHPTFSERAERLEQIGLRFSKKH